MRVKKLKAFTLAEILIVVMIIGVISILALRSLNTKNFEEKQFQASAYKIVEEFQQASVKVREIETESCPASQFAVDIMGDKEYAIYEDGSLANTQQVMDMYSNYLKMENMGLNFCDITTAFSADYCAGAAAGQIIGAKVAGDMYVGLEVIADTNSGELGDCPSYYRVNPNTLVNGNGKCWGRLYFDANGKKGPNVFGQDAFVFGLDESGVIY